MTTKPTIVQFDDVRIPESRQYEYALDHVTFALAPGDCLVVALEEEQSCPALVDVACGLLTPEVGIVWYEGVAWDAMSPDAASTARSRIGQVFETNAWVSNLDLDENITLAQRHHTRRPEEDIRAEALTWAKRFGLPALPTTRPAVTGRHDMQLAQWVRAFLVNPKLLLVERATGNMTDTECEAFVQAVQEKRAEGCAAICLSSDNRFLEHEAFASVLRAKVDHDKWEIST